MGVLQRPPSSHRARIEPLAKLPVFWALEGKRCVVAGGTAAAAWKAELLAACGAQIEIYAEELDACFAALLGGEPPHPAARFIHHRRACNAADLTGAAMAIADCEDDDAARAFFAAARRAGVPVNVIDRPDYCQFQFGSIVNRSPAIVAISTDGAAPILAQAIRRRIEALLPHSLKAWAALAHRLRTDIHARLTDPARRRLFWERFSDLAFAEAPATNALDTLLSEVNRIRSDTEEKGHVSFIGAGPGAAEHLTLKAVRRLQAADTILHEDAVGTEILELARREARRIATGTGGETPERLVERAGKLAVVGQRVVCILAGDARGESGLEWVSARLAQAKIAFEMVPGVASDAERENFGSPPAHVSTSERKLEAATK